MTTPYRFGACTPTFPLPYPMACRDQFLCTWLGGDGGFEAALDSTRSIWTFGDSYFAQAGTGRPQRHVGQVVGSVVGIGTCSQGVWETDLYCSGTIEAPAAFFDDGTNALLNTRFAAQKPFVYAGKLYVVMARIRNVGESFDPVGTVIARINNPAADPSLWQVDYLGLYSGGWSDGVPVFGSEAVVIGGDLVLYGNDAAGHLYPCKLPLAALPLCLAGGDLSGSLSYWNGVAWMPGVVGADRVAAGIVTTSGLSVRYDSALGQWLAVWADTTVDGGFPAYASVALGATPWQFDGDVRRLYYRESAPGDALFNADNAVYGVHEITDFEAEPGRGPIRLAYTVGSRAALTGGDQTRQLVDLSCYKVSVAEFANPFV